MNEINVDCENITGFYSHSMTQELFGAEIHL